jgi:hypothetical protein
MKVARRFTFPAALDRQLRSGSDAIGTLSRMQPPKSLWQPCRAPAVMLLRCSMTRRVQLAFDGIVVIGSSTDSTTR